MVGGPVTGSLSVGAVVATDAAASAIATSDPTMRSADPAVASTEDGGLRSWRCRRLIYMSWSLDVNLCLRLRWLSGYASEIRSKGGCSQG